MPYRALLETLLRSLPGADATLLLDAQGEVVIEAGAADKRHHLIGAYQGIGLAAVRRSSNRRGGGAIRAIACRYHGGSVILAPLKDDYYLMVSLAPGANIALATYRSEETRERLNREI